MDIFSDFLFLGTLLQPTPWLYIWGHLSSYILEWASRKVIFRSNSVHTFSADILLQPYPPMS